MGDQGVCGCECERALDVINTLALVSFVLTFMVLVLFACFRLNVHAREVENAREQESESLPEEGDDSGVSDVVSAVAPV